MGVHGGLDDRTAGVDRAAIPGRVEGDVLHGGLTFALADTAFAFACNAYNKRSFAASAHINFLRPALRGDELTALATEDYRGRRSGYYSVRVSNQRGELVALFRGRSAVTGEPLT